MPLPYIPKNINEAVTLLMTMQRDIDSVKGVKGKLSHSMLNDIAGHEDYITADGFRPFKGPLDLGGNEIRNSANPIINIRNFSDAEVVMKDRELAINYGLGRKQVNTDKIPEGTEHKYWTTERSGFGSASILVISGGSVNVASDIKWLNYAIDTEGGSVSDDLTAISGGQAGAVMVLSAANSARVTTIKKGGGLHIQADFSLKQYDTITLMCVSSGVWKEMMRSNNE